MTASNPALPRRVLCVLFAAVTILAGLALRLLPLGLPAWLVKYGGSALWAVMIYWLVAVIGRSLSRMQISVAASLTAVAVELFKLVRTPALDAFRHTLAGKLLLGRVFSWLDIAVYLVAIGCVALLDRKPAAADRPSLTSRTSPAASPRRRS